MLSLTVIPNSPVTDKIELDIRAFHLADASGPGAMELRLNGRVLDETRWKDQTRHTLRRRLPTRGLVGDNRVELIARTPAGEERREERLRVMASEHRSPGRLAGMWNGIYHWSEEEGRRWNRDIARLNEEGWREQVRAMAALEMNVMVIQETFRNECYYGRHNIPARGYRGRAFYPSALYPGRMPVAAADPVEAILDEADRVGMKVFPGVGMYAWFDYTPDSLVWHKAVATELWSRYGHHPSFYGFYVSEEVCGDLGGTPKARAEIVDFFAGFREHCAGLAPDKPVMLAPNCHYINRARDDWPRLLENLDILCPFAFHRMNQDDIGGEAAARTLQDWCDAADTHLWLDMECFLFEPDMALYPRPLAGLLDDLHRFPNFEKILGYQYAGLFCAPDATIKVGGKDAVELYRDYADYIAGVAQETACTV